MSLKPLSKKQENAFDDCMNFFLNSERSAFVLSGVAGSGKTELVRHLNVMLEGASHMPVVNCAFTGRATSVLRSKLMNITEISPSSSTLHALLYKAILDERGILVGFEKKNRNEITALYGAMIVDEASMVNEAIFNDLMELGIPILFVGDSEQLPPIDSNGFNVMEHADVHMTEIHRQAEGNPIIALSRMIRETGKINITDDMDGICVVPKHDVTKSFLKNNPVDMILTGTNRERVKMYKLSRITKGYDADAPVVNERVICLKNSTLSEQSIYNGELYTIEDIVPYNKKADRFCLKADGMTQSFWVLINKKCWDEDPDVMIEDANKGGYGVFTFGDAASVWKAQGSEFDSVLFLDEDVSYFVDRRRFRYTAVTRAKNKLIIAQ